MARLLPVVALGTALALALGGAAYAATKDKDEPSPLPPPDDDATCSSAADVSEATSEILADNTIDANGLRNAAKVLEEWTTYCDAAAMQAGAASAKLLRTKADILDGIGERPFPTPIPDQPTGSLWPVPPGYTNSHHMVEGLHGEPGMLYTYPDGGQWFFPDNTLLIPYYLPDGGLIVGTQGCEECSL